MLHVALKALKSNGHTHSLILLSTQKLLFWQTLPLKVSDTNVPIASVGITFLFWMRTRAWQLTDGLCSEPTSPVSVWHLGLRDVTDGFLPTLITVRRVPAPFCTNSVEQPLLLYHKHNCCAPKLIWLQKMRLLNGRKVTQTQKLQLLKLCPLTPLTPVPFANTSTNTRCLRCQPALKVFKPLKTNSPWRLADVQRLGATFWRKPTVLDIQLISLQEQKKNNCCAEREWRLSFPARCFLGWDFCSRVNPRACASPPHLQSSGPCSAPDTVSVNTKWWRITEKEEILWHDCKLQSKSPVFVLSFVFPVEGRMQALKLHSSQPL